MSNNRQAEVRLVDGTWEIRPVCGPTAARLDFKTATVLCIASAVQEVAAGHPDRAALAGWPAPSADGQALRLLLRTLERQRQDADGEPEPAEAALWESAHGARAALAAGCPMAAIAAGDRAIRIGPRAKRWPSEWAAIRDALLPHGWATTEAAVARCPVGDRTCDVVVGHESGAVWAQDIAWDVGGQWCREWHPGDAGRADVLEAVRHAYGWQLDAPLKRSAAAIWAYWWWLADDVPWGAIHDAARAWSGPRRNGATLARLGAPQALGVWRLWEKLDVVLHPSGVVWASDAQRGTPGEVMTGAAVPQILRGLENPDPKEEQPAYAAALMRHAGEEARRERERAEHGARP